MPSPRRALPLLSGALLVAVALSACGSDLPDVGALDAWRVAPTKVYARDGRLLGTLPAGGADGVHVSGDVVPLADVSRALRDAVVTNEDRRFYAHAGLDLPGLGRALWRTLGGRTEGGSTLTQQLVKNTLLADLHGARTAERKLKEAVLARRVEARYSKDQILEAYLNVVYWGSGGKRDIVGVQDAARAYFGKDARDLDLAEGAYLATLLPSPGRFFDYAAGRPRVRALLDRMVEDGRATRAEADAAWREPIQPAGWRVRYGPAGEVAEATLVDREAKNRALAALAAPPYPQILRAVARELAAELGEGRLARGGLTVRTSLDPAAQDAAERAAARAALPEGADLGLALVDPASGAVLALVGGKPGAGGEGGWDNATLARRQVGSTVKPFLYALALERGREQGDTVLDAPPENTSYRPQNYDGRFLNAPVTLRAALDRSLNLPGVRLLQELGVNDFKAKLRDLGLDPAPNADLALAVGALETSPLKLAAAYAAFANGGVWHEPRLVAAVEGPDGEALALPPPTERRVWDERTAYLAFDLLRGVVNDLGPAEGGLAWKARLPGWDVGGKTGTTNDVKDLWFAGVTARLAGAVWVGRPKGGALPRDAYSGDVAAPIWQEAASGALANTAPASLARPDGITDAWTDGLRMAFRTERAPDPFAGRGWNEPERTTPRWTAPEDDRGWTRPEEDPGGSAPPNDPPPTAPEEEPSWSAPDQDPGEGAPQEDPSWSTPDQDPGEGAPQEDPLWSTPDEEPTWAVPEDDAGAGGDRSPPAEPSAPDFDWP